MAVLRIEGVDVGEVWDVTRPVNAGEMVTSADVRLLPTISCGGVTLPCEVRGGGDMVATIRVRVVDVDRVNQATILTRAAFIPGARVTIVQDGKAREMVAQEAVSEELPFERVATFRFKLAAVPPSARAEPPPAREWSPCDGCGAEPKPSKGFASWTHAEDCPHVLEAARAERRAREAPLVALVNAVPDGLDANGWRAAVLAVHEVFPHKALAGPRGAWADGAGPGLAAAIRGECRVRDDAPYASGIAAYRRAIAPHKAPPPERKGATWKTRGTLFTQHADEA
jgi:hypothetical protein